MIEAHPSLHEIGAWRERDLYAERHVTFPCLLTTTAPEGIFGKCQASAVMFPIDVWKLVHSFLHSWRFNTFQESFCNQDQSLCSQIARLGVNPGRVETRSVDIPIHNKLRGEKGRFTTCSCWISAAKASWLASCF